MDRKLLVLWVVCVLLGSGCGNGVLEPGKIARPLSGTYALERLTESLLDSAGTVVSILEPPELRSYLVLVLNGRYGQIDSLFVGDSVQVFVETGRWSVRSDEFYVESDQDRIDTEKFTYDGIRLKRIASDTVGNRAYTYVWRRR